jgi:hypothetical protein
VKRARSAWHNELATRLAHAEVFATARNAGIGQSRKGLTELHYTVGVHDCVIAVRCGCPLRRLAAAGQSIRGVSIVSDKSRDMLQQLILPLPEPDRLGG